MESDRSDKFTWQAGDVIFPQCCSCRHSEGAVCTAFPEGMPRIIRDNQADHRLPYEGDHGIRFEPSDLALTVPATLAALYRVLDAIDDDPDGAIEL